MGFPTPKPAANTQRALNAHPSLESPLTTHAPFQPHPRTPDPTNTRSLFGTRCLAGVLAGSLVSGVQMAVSMSNTGGAWDNAKKYIEVRRRRACRALCTHCKHAACALACSVPLRVLAVGWCGRVRSALARMQWQPPISTTHTQPNLFPNPQSTPNQLPNPFSQCNRPAPASTRATWVARAPTATRRPSSATPWAIPSRCVGGWQWLQRLTPVYTMGGCGGTSTAFAGVVWLVGLQCYWTFEL